MGALALLLSVLCGGCAGSQVRDKPAQLRVVSEPTTAVVYVDEHYVAPARKLADHPASLRPGTRRLTVQAPGYFPHDMEVELAPGVTTIEIKLRQVPP